MRRENPELRENELEYHIEDANPRLLSYTKGGIRVIVNAGRKAVDIGEEGEVLFSNLLSGRTLKKDGVAVIRKN